MTVQISEEFECKDSNVDFESLRLYAIVTGDIHWNGGWGEEYPFKQPPFPADDRTTNSACWRGYIARFRLHGSGELEFVCYRTFSESKGIQWRFVGEILTGDFYLLMKPTFNALRVYVPFRNGRIVADKSEWIREQPRVDRTD